MPTFYTTLHQAPGRPVTGIIVPPEIVDALNAGKKPLVVMTVNGYSYRSAVANMGGQYMVSFSSEHRAATGLKGGDAIAVEITLDSEPRTVELPADFAEALDAAGLRAAFDRLAPSHQKEHVRAIAEAKAADTRARRIAKAIEKLGA